MPKHHRCMAGRGFSLLCSWVATVWMAHSAVALETLTIGKDAQIDWDGSGSSFPTIDPQYRALNPNEILTGNLPGDLISFNHPRFPGSLIPRQLEEGENVAVGTIARGGSIQSTNVQDIAADELKTILEELLTNQSGGELLAFERKNLNRTGWLVEIDLGGRFGVSRIRFYPRNTVQRSPSTPFHQDFVRAFELYVNDGINLTKEGNPIWGEPLSERKENTDPVVDVLLEPPRYVQFFRLKSTSPVDFEIDEIEIFGTGFVPTARYFSDVFDLNLASWGKIYWNEHVIGDSSRTRLLISTRTGRDETPFVFTRKLANKEDAEEISTSLHHIGQSLTQEEYEDLPQRDSDSLKWEAGSVKDDLQNWSPWSTAYAPEGATPDGTPILSPGPRRYIQFQVLALSEDLASARLLDDVSIEYLAPTLADQIEAEIFPREVPASTITTFIYAVRPTMETEGLLGFDAFEISSPLRVEGVDKIEIFDPNGSLTAEHDFTLEDSPADSPFGITAIEDNEFTVRFPLIQESESLLKITFRAAVLVYSSSFSGRASFSGEPGAIQTAVPGDVAKLGKTDDPTLSGTTVFSPSTIEGRLIDTIETVPNIFTPNGDRINDRVSIVYDVLTLTKAGKTAVQIYDIAGRLVHTLQDENLRSGRYFHEWDGLDAAGNRVPPGIYLLSVSVDGDNRNDARTKPIAVIY